MDANLLTRFTVAGWAFALSWPLQAWILGADFNSVSASLGSPQTLPVAVAAVLVALTAGPILGFMMNTFAYGIMSLCRGGDPEFEVPRSAEQLEQYISALQNLYPLPESNASLAKIAASIQGEFTPKWWQVRKRRPLRQHIDKLIPYFNVQFHGRATATLIEHATRRWTIYWMYANSICALAVGTFFASITSGSFLNRNFIFDQKLFIEIALAVFVTFGVRSMVRIPTQIHALAFLWLYREASEYRSKQT